MEPLSGEGKPQALRKLTSAALFLPDPIPTPPHAQQSSDSGTHAWNYLMPQREK